MSSETIHIFFFFFTIYNITGRESILPILHSSTRIMWQEKFLSFFFFFGRKTTLITWCCLEQLTANIGLMLMEPQKIYQNLSSYLMATNWESQLWHSGTIASETYTGHWHYFPHFTSFCTGDPQDQSWGISGEPLMASSPKGFMSSPLTHMGISPGTPPPLRGVWRSSFSSCSSLNSWFS